MCYTKCIIGYLGVLYDTNRSTKKTSITKYGI